MPLRNTLLQKIHQFLKDLEQGCCTQTIFRARLKSGKTSYFTILTKPGNFRLRMNPFEQYSGFWLNGQYYTKQEILSEKPSFANENAALALEFAGELFNSN